MTSKKQKATGGPTPARKAAGQRAADGVSQKLQSYYDSIVDEGIPDTFLTLLERLDAADAAVTSGGKKKTP